MNEILKALSMRKSVRVFTEEEIAREEKEQILNAALQAPSAGCRLQAGGRFRRGSRTG